jgi:polyhydroxyalkanoate synthesis regulator phasin
MKDIIEKGINLGLGIAATTKEKVENLVDEMIAKGQIEKQEKSAAVKEILNKLEKSEAEFKERTKAVVNETVNNIGFATKTEVNNLKETIADLQKKINSLKLN